MATQSDLPDYDGNSAFKGALRFFDPEDESWRKKWGGGYGSLMPNVRIFSSDAFGTVFGLLNDNTVAIFWAETGELERLGVGVEEFYEMILQDPVNTINYDLYLSCLDRFGRLSLDQHFAFKIETALGGELTPENIVVMDSDLHFRAMGKLANQLKDIQDGQHINNISLEK